MTASFACRAAEPSTNGHWAAGLSASTWSLDPTAKVYAPDSSLAGTVEYRSPAWRLLLVAPYYFGRSPAGADLGGMGRLVLGADLHLRIASHTVVTPYVRALLDTVSAPGIRRGNAEELGVGVTYILSSMWSVTGRLGMRHEDHAGAGGAAMTWLGAANFHPGPRDGLQLAIVNLPTRAIANPDARYLSLVWGHAFRSRWSLQCYATMGLTAASPKYGVGIGGMVRLN